MCRFHRAATQLSERLIPLDPYLRELHDQLVATSMTIRTRTVIQLNVGDVFDIHEFTAKQTAFQNGVAAANQGAPRYNPADQNCPLRCQ